MTGGLSLCAHIQRTIFMRVSLQSQNRQLNGRYSRRSEEHTCEHLLLYRREEACLRRISHNAARVSGKTCSIYPQQALAISPHYGIECHGEQAYWASSLEGMLVTNLALSTLTLSENHVRKPTFNIPHLRCAGGCSVVSV